MDQNRRQGPTQEYLLQGSILNESVETLLHRLQCMCDNPEEGLVSFKEHEIVFSMREGNSPGVVSVRVRKQLTVPDQPWTLTYLGNPEIGDRNRPTNVRTCVEVNVTQNICTFLKELGFMMDFEFVSQGWVFRKNRLRARVTRVCQLTNPPSTALLNPISKSHLVEVSMISGSGNEAAANEVHSFSEQLRPLVNLDKLDPRRLPGS